MAELLALEHLVQRERLIVAIGLGAVVALAWAYLFAGAGTDMSMADMARDMPMPWSPSYAALMFTMWCVMMIAMMVPSAASMVLLFATIRREQAAAFSPFVEAWIFLAGYLLIWAGFRLVALMARGLECVGLIAMTMVSTGRHNGRRGDPRCRGASTGLSTRDAECRIIRFVLHRSSAFPAGPQP
jgi:predicted metal-binding membrane protein